MKNKNSNASCASRVYARFRLLPSAFCLLLIALLVLAAALFIGPVSLFTYHWGDPTLHIILKLRALRVATAFTVGAGLATSGVIMQAVMRNPLAEPYILGVSSGGGLGAALLIATGFSLHLPFAIPLAAFVAALLTLGLVYLLASSKGPPNTYDLLLCGIAVSALCSSLLMLLVSISHTQHLQGILWWMLGNMQNTDLRVLLPAASAIVLSLAAAILLSRDLNALTLGREMAHHLGVNTRQSITLALVTATLAAAAAVGLSGLIGFVGLVAPHAVRKLIGPDHRLLLPASALAGGTFLVFCDLLSRTALLNREIPVGVITALIGAPCFLLILRKAKS